MSLRIWRTFASSLGSFARINEALERFRRVMPVVDMLNKQYGRDTGRLAGANPRGRWRTKAAKRSPRYTTKLSEVPLIS